jgi:hypothetical protein
MADIRILGVGVGTFLIVAFAILWILLCIAGRVFKRSSWVRQAHDLGARRGGAGGRYP